MRVTIAQVDKNLFDGQAYSLSVPGAEGQMIVLARHMPLITTLKPGAIIVRESREAVPQEFQIESGILEVTGEGATVIL